jgi:hypothetical protein
MPFTLHAALKTPQNSGLAIKVAVRPGKPTKGAPNQQFRRFGGLCFSPNYSMETT